eukprot:4960761-Pleurochrysis_carterae.AAC.1
MQGDRSQRAIDTSAVLGTLRNQMFCYWQRTPVSLPVPTAVAFPSNRAYVQFRGAPATGQTMVSNVTQAQSQQIDCPHVTAKLRETLDKQRLSGRNHNSILES